MYCKNCGNQMDDLASICVKCGVAKGKGFKYCDKCGKEIPQQTDVCLGCGNLLKNNSFINNGQLQMDDIINRINTPNGYATISLILGIISIIGSFSSLVWALACSVVAIVLGRKAINGKTEKTSVAKAGITLAIIALVIRAVILITLFLTMFGIELAIK